MNPKYKQGDRVGKWTITDVYFTIMANQGQKKYKTALDAVRAYDKHLSQKGSKGSDKFAMLELQVQDHLDRDLASLAENNGVPIYDY